MPTTTRAFLFALVLVALAATGGHAQQMQMMQPAPLDPNDPRAQRAAEMVQLLLAGDADAAIAYAGEHGAPASADGDSLEAGIRAVLAEIGDDGAFLLDGLDDGPGFVLVRLRNPAGGGTAALIVGMEPAAPHRITQLRPVRIEFRSTGG
jgi:hypothetical protein